MFHNKKGMSEIQSCIIPITLFWIFIPLVFMIYNVGGASNSFQNELINLQTMENPTVFNYLSMFFSGMGIFLKMAFLWVDGMPLFVNMILWALRIISLFIILITLRG